MSKLKLFLCMLLTVTTVFCVVASANSGITGNLLTIQPEESSVVMSESTGIPDSALPPPPTLVPRENIVPGQNVTMVFGVPVGGPTAGNENVKEDTNQSSTQPSPEELELAKLNVCVPVIMYHSITSDPMAQSEYCISDALLENDFIAYKNAGFTPISMQTYLQMADAYRAAAEASVDRELKLHELRTLLQKYPNPILLTFDDGYEDWYTILYPLALKHNVNVNLSLVGYYSDGKGMFLSGQEIQELAMCDLISFGNHTNNLHDISNATLQQLYDKEENRTFVAIDYLDCEGIIRMNTGRSSVFMSYPYGMQSDLTESILNDMGLRVSLATNITSRVPQLSDGTRVVPRINRTPWTTSAEFVTSIVEKIKAQNTSAYNVENPMPISASNDSGIRPVIVEKDGLTYRFEGKLNGDTAVLAMQDIRGAYPEITINYNVPMRAFCVQLFDKLVVVDYIHDLLSCEGRVMQIPHSTIAQIPVRSLFEIAGYQVTYDATNKTIHAINTEPKTVAVEPGV